MLVTAIHPPAFSLSSLDHPVAERAGLAVTAAEVVRVHVDYRILLNFVSRHGVPELSPGHASARLIRTVWVVAWIESHFRDCRADRHVNEDNLTVIDC